MANSIAEWLEVNQSHFDITQSDQFVDYYPKEGHQLFLRGQQQEMITIKHRKGMPSVVVTEDGVAIANLHPETILELKGNA